MAKRVIKCKINVKALDKYRMFVGEKGIYANITLIETPGGTYGDWMIVEDIKKEEADAGKKGTMLGNGKNYGWGDSPKPNNAPPSTNDLPY
jgi:hypothetical protein